MPRDRFFVPGSFYRTSDFSGFKTRSYDTEKLWNGLWVRRDKEAEPRQSQDFVRGMPDQQSVPEPRSRPVDSFVGPLFTTTTAACAAAATNIAVASSVRMFAGDTVALMLDNGQQFLVVLADVPGDTLIVLQNGLPWSMASGNEVEDITANVTVTAANYPPSNGPG